MPGSESVIAPGAKALGTACRPDRSRSARSPRKAPSGPRNAQTTTDTLPGRTCPTRFSALPSTKPPAKNSDIIGEFGVWPGSGTRNVAFESGGYLLSYVFEWISKSSLRASPPVRTSFGRTTRMCASNVACEEGVAARATP